MQTLGRYEIIEQIGAGAMGAVYRAKDPMMGREVAIKTILTTALEGPHADEYRERFFREAQAAGRLAHPGIVTLYDVSEHQGTPFLVMEFVTGRTLQSILETERVPVEQACEFGIQVSEALNYAHQHGVIHRDIKPANILITSDGRAKIADFGVAKLAEAQVTSTGQLLGTPAFMAPEQFVGARIDGRADLFAVGVVMYWMATGDKPFAGDSILAVQYKIVNTEPVPPRKLNPTIPQSLEAIILKSVAKDPAARYQSGDELVQDLRALQMGRPVSAQTVVVRSDEMQTVGATTTVTVSRTIPATIVESEPPRPPQPPPTSRWVAVVVVAAIAIVGSVFWLRTPPPEGPPPAVESAAPAATSTPTPTPTPQPSAETKAPAATKPDLDKIVEKVISDSIAEVAADEAARKNGTIRLELTSGERNNVVFRSEGQPAQMLTMKPGDTINLQAQKEGVLTVANANALQVKLNGKPISLGTGRGGNFVITPEGVDESRSSTPRAGRSIIGSPAAQRELSKVAGSVPVAIKSSAFPEFLTLVVRLDDAVFLRREAIEAAPPGINEGRRRAQANQVPAVSLLEERLIPPGHHKIQVTASLGAGRPGQSREIEGEFESGKRRTLNIEFAREPERGGANERLLNRMMVTLE
jgi:serine/threonine protein kinase